MISLMTCAPPLLAFVNGSNSPALDHRRLRNMRELSKPPLRNPIRILATFAALLGIAQIEAGTRRSRFDDVDLAAVVRLVVETFGPSAEEEGKALLDR